MNIKREMTYEELKVAYREKVARVQELEHAYEVKLGQWSEVCQNRDKYELRSRHLERQNKRLLEVLKFYANDKNYERRFEKGHESMVDIDGGHRATEAMEEFE